MLSTGEVTKRQDLERRLTNRFFNPLVVGLLRRGLGPATYALVETIGRTTGLPRVMPVANGLDGDVFWLIAGLGERATFVRNLRANPQVRVLARPAACDGPGVAAGAPVPPCHCPRTTSGPATGRSVAAGRSIDSTASRSATWLPAGGR